MRIDLGRIAGQKNGKTLGPNWQASWWKKDGLVWQCVSDLVRQYIAIAGRLLIVLDDTTYGKTGKTISGCSTHFDHAAKTNSSRWI